MAQVLADAATERADLQLAAAALDRAWQSAEQLGRELSTHTVQYGLPTETEWEKGARGGLIGKRYSWGDEPPDHDRCDFDHFGAFVIRAPRELPPNGYGLHGMCGGVWEWTADPYDALAYHPRRLEPAATPAARVLRGGSFTDDEAAVTVSFRMAQESRDWRDQGGSPHLSPNIGFRLVRRAGEFRVPARAPSPEAVRRVPLSASSEPGPAKPSLWARLFGARKK